MTAYDPPLDEMRFVINELAGLEDVAALPGLEDVTPELVDSILEEAGKLGAEILAPINQSGDEQGSVLENGVVRTPDGFRDAYRQFIDGGWNGMPFDPEYGGQGLPWLVATAATEIWHSANMAFMLCPLLTQAGIELLINHGSDELRAIYLEKLVSGVWSGTMNLTEPQAGSDLARVRCRADKDGDVYRLSGTKIFITYGEHDMAENIIHMVLARTPDAPTGVKGLSLFVVPKFVVKEDGSLGERNDLRCVSIEHKLGIRASPTAVMSYGDNDGAVGYLVGEENHGIEYMFTMMNNARLAVGLEGVAIGERAFQGARAYARERIQSRKSGSGSPDAVAIIEHPDVKRMLLSMRSQTEATRAVAYIVAGQLDTAKRHPDPDMRRQAQALVDLLVPVVKAWSADVGIAVADMGIQVHGGMGFIEETGAAQHLRDARIAAIYEGTNGIQANDLVGRKVARDEGAAAAAFIAMVRDITAEAATVSSGGVKELAEALNEGVDALEEATHWVVSTSSKNADAIAAGAIPYLRLLSLVAGGWAMTRAAIIANSKIAAETGDKAFYRNKIVTARFFSDHLLVEAPTLSRIVTRGSNSICEIEPDHL